MFIHLQKTRTQYILQYNQLSILNIRKYTFLRELQPVGNYNIILS